MAVSREDSGTYVCWAENRVGRVQAVSFVHVKGEARALGFPLEAGWTPSETGLLTSELAFSTLAVHSHPLDFINSKALGHPDSVAQPPWGWGWAAEGFLMPRTAWLLVQWRSDRSFCRTRPSSWARPCRRQAWGPGHSGRKMHKACQPARGPLCSQERHSNQC